MTGGLATDVVVVPIDDSIGSHRAIPAGVALAEALRVPLQLVTVVSPGVNHVEARVELEDLGSFVHADALLPPKVIESNDVSDALCTLSAERRALLCIATRARGAVASLVLGSTALDVVADVGAPLVLVGPRARTRTLRTVVVALNPASALSMRAVEPGARIAAGAGAAVHLVPVVPPDGEPGAAAAVERELGAQLDRCRALGASARICVTDGADVANALLWAAEDVDADLIAMTTHGRGPWERLALGSIAQVVVHRAMCPVLVVPPHDRG